MGFEGASGFHAKQTGGGGTIGGGGTVNYIPRFTPNGTTLGNSILTQDPGSNPIVTEQYAGYRIVTTDGTTQTLQSIVIPTDTVILIEAKVVARKTAGTGIGTVGDGNGYIRTVKAKNVGGVVTLGIIQSSYTSEDIDPFVTTFDVSGTDVRIRVTGATDDTVEWRTITKVVIAP